MISTSTSLHAVGVNKWQQVDAFPRVALPVHVHLLEEEEEEEVERRGDEVHGEKSVTSPH